MVKSTILVVDDDVYIIRMLKKALENADYTVIGASNGNEAINHCFEKKFELILLDVKMPGIDGYGVCQEVRKFSDVPIIMVTAKGSEEDIVKGLEIGADDYVVKPFSLQELMARIKSAIRRNQSGEKHETPIFVSGDLK